MIVIDREAQDRLRALRLWHWRRAMLARKSQRELAKLRGDAYATAMIEAYEAEVSAHIKAVQTLNDFFPPGDNAEGDAAMEGE